jgi:two-component system C4-dicarboxylate transport sensor histidine kinase DctB
MTAGDSMEASPRKVRRWPRLSLRVVGALAGIAAVAWVLNALAFEAAIQNMRGSAGHQLDVYAASLEREIDRFAQVPFVLGLDDTVVRLLRQPDDPGLRIDANFYLAKLNDRIGTLDVYVLDKQGVVVAASNWNQWDSFVTRDLSYRPYYQNAAIGVVSRFYGIGTTNRQPGYFLATALHEAGAIKGVGVVKVSLEQLERSWASADAPAILTDEHGVVVLSSVPAWKYGTLTPLDDVARRQIAEAQQFNYRDLSPIGMTVRRVLDPATQLVHFSATARGGESSFSTAGLFLAQTRRMAGTPWNITVFADLSSATSLAQLEAGVGTLALVVAVGFLVAFQQRRAHVRELLAARAALQQAHDHLESEVADRTAALSASNAQLSREVEERNRAEHTLREAQAGLVEASKLAVIGQLSAGIAHELNQPLAALQTLAGNASKYLERGDIGTARANLDRLGPLVSRMGGLTGELKIFARRSSGDMDAHPVGRMIDNALFLINHRIVQGQVGVNVTGVRPDMTAWCDANRYEQVLLNVIGNALDAMDGQAERRLDIRVAEDGPMLTVEVADNGPGLPPERMAHLFEPFYTTKAPGVGLGLGLAISAGIMRDFGGSLTARNGEDRGAVFTLTLPRERTMTA